MDRSLEEAKLAEFCEGLGIGAAINWLDQPVSLCLVKSEEPTLFGPADREGKARLTVVGGKACYFFEWFRIDAADLAKITRLFLAAYTRHLEDYYIDHVSAGMAPIRDGAERDD